MESRFGCSKRFFETRATRYAAVDCSCQETRSNLEPTRQDSRSHVMHFRNEDSSTTAYNCPHVFQKSVVALAKVCRCCCNRYAAIPAGQKRPTLRSAQPTIRRPASEFQTYRLALLFLWPWPLRCRLKVPCQRRPAWYPFASPCWLVVAVACCLHALSSMTAGAERWADYTAVERTCPRQSVAVTRRHHVHMSKTGLSKGPRLLSRGEMACALRGRGPFHGLTPHCSRPVIHATKLQVYPQR